MRFWLMSKVDRFFTRKYGEAFSAFWMKFKFKEHLWSISSRFS
ncbi:hypothetical protein CAMSH0001_2228 [Campylobacter showae RM3277]|uniref:Uncharacterized protein n=1 Tax=Campylobacter showae RM3277 TaxID=553219 RepID=C6RFW5_9BACT|nr:hypothetical protein CAMSH0001_2228 [Campylobacter showae RM3277]